MSILNELREVYINEKLSHAKELERYFTPKEYQKLVDKINKTNGFTLPSVAVTYENTEEKWGKLFEMVNNKLDKDLVKKKL